MGPRLRVLAVTIAGTIVVSCTAFMPKVNFEAPARALGIAAPGGRCPRSTGELVEASFEASGGKPTAALPGDIRRDFACISLRDDLTRDEMADCTPPVAAVFETPLPARRRVEGDLAYVGLDPREYAYDLVPENGSLGVEVRIAFRGELVANPSVHKSLDAKLEEASALWSRFSPGGRMRFRFRAVTRADHPHYEIDLASGDARTPFDLTWGEAWSAHLIAHEVGHMMGLDDEYPQFRKTLGHALGRESAWRADPALRLEWLHCDLQSLMCDSKGDTAVPLPHHYYVIARRRFCRRKSFGFNEPF
jgi:hypothetical protein